MRYTVVARACGLGPAKDLAAAVTSAQMMSEGLDCEIAVYQGPMGIEEKIAVFRHGRRTFPVGAGRKPDVGVLAAWNVAARDAAQKKRELQHPKVTTTPAFGPDSD